MILRRIEKLSRYGYELLMSEVQGRCSTGQLLIAKEKKGETPRADCNLIISFDVSGVFQVLPSPHQPPSHPKRKNFENSMKL